MPFVSDSPTRRNVHVRPIQLTHGSAPQQPQCALDIGTQNLQRTRDASFSSGGEAVGVGPAAQDRTRSQTQSLYDIAPATNAAVHQDLGLAVHSRNHFGQRSDGSAYAVELPAAVIRDAYRGSAFIDRTLGIFARQDTFYDDGPTPEFANP